MEDDLTWLARNVTDSHMCDWYIKVADGYSSMTGGTPTGMSGTWCSRKQIIQRRAELQNKPSWADAPEWATHLAQNGRGQWWFMLNGKLLGDSGRYFESDRSTIEVARGEVLGDWRDTLERRPVDLSEPVVTKRLTEAAENVLEAAPELVKDTYKFEGCEDMIERIYWEFDSVRAKKLNPERDIFKRFVRSAMVHIGPAEKLIRLLTTSPDSFTSSELMEIHQLVDTELNKRDAAVCGGKKYLDAHWFERGELPPVGVECEFHGGARFGREWPNSLKDGAKVKVLCHYTPCIRPVAVFSFDIPGGKLTSQASEVCFRPIRTERDLAVEEMMKDAGALQWETPKSIMLSLYDAGYRKQSLPAD